MPPNLFGGGVVGAILLREGIMRYAEVVAGRVGGFAIVTYTIKYNHFITRLWRSEL